MTGECDLLPKFVDSIFYDLDSELQSVLVNVEELYKSLAHLLIVQLCCKLADLVYQSIEVRFLHTPKDLLYNKLTDARLGKLCQVYEIGLA